MSSALTLPAPIFPDVAPPSPFAKVSAHLEVRATALAANRIEQARLEGVALGREVAQSFFGAGIVATLVVLGFLALNGVISINI